ncbi:MAG: hypothetical protein KGJ35_00120 [Patescibacteria group bacterium]|nr:hypothetical protein [Patescibacteria group bacterium]
MLNPDDVFSQSFEQTIEKEPSIDDVFSSEEELKTKIQQEQKIEFNPITEIIPPNYNSGSENISYHINIYKCSDGRYCAIAINEGYARLVWMDTNYQLVKSEADIDFHNHIRA